MPTNYYRVEDAATGELRIIIRDADGDLARYDGDGRWVDDNGLIRWFGAGGDAHDGEIAQGDLDATIQELEHVWTLPMPSDADVLP